MPTKKKLLKELERKVVGQEKEKIDLEESEEITGKKLDEVEAPAVDVEEELKKKWKYEETEREIGEEKQFTNEGDIEKEEKAGEEPYPEIGEAIKKDADEDEEDN